MADGNRNHGRDRRGGEEEEIDGEMWANFSGTFRKVQTVLDRNRSLIQQVNDNHQSRIPDNMAKNVPLIQEINHNISTVSSLYSDLSSNFVSSYHHRNGKDADGRRDGGNKA
ncbi:unnamed protein product [Linum tenue]|uniref:Protein EARLY FLOWERING 4 domain-containing protein n=1 Tax=Linum tenue TaxID=586396 RepID=A0AAV0K1F1_9ROSI|nr:unnamed protein product [Linum tenue]